MTRTCVAQAQVWRAQHTFHFISCVIFMPSCCVFDSPRLLHFPLFAHHLLSYRLVFPPGHQLLLPRCGGQIPCAYLPMRTFAPLPSTTLSHFAGTDSRILRYAVCRVLAGDGVLIYEGLTLLHAILRQVDRDLSEYHMKNLTLFHCLRREGDCSRDVEKLCSNRPSRRRLSGSQTGTPSLSTLSSAEVVFTSQVSTAKKPRIHNTSFPYHEVVLSLARHVPIVLRA